MRIVYLSDSYFPSKTANSVHVMKMCEGFASLHHEVMVTGLKQGKLADSDILNHYNINHPLALSLNRLKPIKGILLLHALLNILKVLKNDPQLVIGRSFLSMYLAGVFRRTMIFETHSPIRALGGLQRWCFLRIIKRARGVIVISQALKEILIQELHAIGMGHVKVYVHHDGATVPAQKVPEEVMSHRDSLNIGYIGTVNKGRGIELILKMANLMPHHQFHIIGGDRQSLKEKLLITDIPFNIVLHGYKMQKEIEVLAATMDVFIAPYQYETYVNSGINTADYMSPLKIFEYMSYQRPIVASDLPVIREVLNEECAILVDPENVELWCRAIDALVSNEKRIQLYQAAYSLLITRYSWRKRAENILNNLNYEHSDYHSPRGQ